MIVDTLFGGTAELSPAKPSSGSSQLVHGVALGEDDITLGKSENRKIWRRSGLKSAAESLRGKPIVKDHTNNSVDAVVGQINKAEYKDGVGVIYEGEVDDEELAKKVQRGRLEVSPRVHHPEELSENDDGVLEVEEINEFQNLSLVPRGAAPSNEVTGGPSPDISSAELALSLGHSAEELTETSEGSESSESGSESEEDADPSETSEADESESEADEEELEEDSEKTDDEELGEDEGESGPESEEESEEESESDEETSDELTEDEDLEDSEETSGSEESTSEDLEVSVLSDEELREVTTGNEPAETENDETDTMTDEELADSLAEEIEQSEHDAEELTLVSEEELSSIREENEELRKKAKKPVAEALSEVTGMGVEMLMDGYDSEQLREEYDRRMEELSEEDEGRPEELGSAFSSSDATPKGEGDGEVEELGGETESEGETEELSGEVREEAEELAERIEHFDNRDDHWGSAASSARERFEELTGVEYEEGVVDEL